MRLSRRRKKLQQKRREQWDRDQSRYSLARLAADYSEIEWRAMAALLEAGTSARWIGPFTGRTTSSASNL